MDKDTQAEPAAEQLPQSGGSYIREADGSLTLQKPKATLADLVAGKQAAATKPNEPTQE